MAEKANKPTKSSKSTAKNVKKTTSSAVSKKQIKKVTKLSTKKYPSMGGFWERFLAFFLDGLIVGFLSYLLSFFVALPLLGLGALSSLFAESSSGTFMSAPFIGFSFLLGVATTTLYFGYFYTKDGQSLGKKVMNLKVVKAHDLSQPITWGDTFIREVIGKYISRFFLSLGYLWYFMSEKRQTWHDSIAKTYVVKVDDSGNIVMGNKKSYPKNPLATFGCCGCFGLIIILSILAFIATAGVVATQLMNNRGEIEQEFEKYMDIPQNDPNVMETPEDFQRYFEEQLEQELQDYQEQQL